MSPTPMLAIALRPDLRTFVDPRRFSRRLLYESKVSHNKRSALNSAAGVTGKTCWQADAHACTACFPIRDGQSRRHYVAELYGGRFSPMNILRSSSYDAQIPIFW